QFKKVFIVIFCVCVFTYLCLDYNLRTKLLRFRDGFDFKARVDDTVSINEAYFVDTPGCRMPKFDVMDDTIGQFINNPKPYTCQKPRPLFRPSETEPAVLVLGMTNEDLWDHYSIDDWSVVHCNYTMYIRRTDMILAHSKSVPIKFAKKVQLPLPTEIVCIECFNHKNISFNNDCHFFVPPKKPRKKQPESASANRTKERISVMILGIDSVSHLNFLRQMKKSSAYVREKLNHVEMWGYNKVGDNTFPNIVPLLSGLDEQELNISCNPLHKKRYDNCSFIWKRFHNLGYLSTFAEDVAYLGAFNYMRPGFKEQPTDYYLRPYVLVMEASHGHNFVVNLNLCLGSRRTADVLFEYIKQMVPLLSQHLFFSFFWTTSLTHDFFSLPALLDNTLMDQLKQFHESGVLNRTVVLLLSDHGMRWGSFRRTYQGMMEEHQPLMMLLYPPWMKQRYPQAIANLELNAHRLTTPFDVHATMLSLLDLDNLEANELHQRAVELEDPDSTLPRGISLFLPVPEVRTCEQAGIAAHWCTCHQRRVLPTNDARVQRAARYLVRLINNRIKSSPQCRTLYLNAILQGLIAAPHSKFYNNISTEYSVEITMRLQTKPGLAVFESTVRMTGYDILLTGTISRLNLYGSQSYCLDDPSLKMFCYCH
ncbi:hypothetical protein KR018_000281, partial [Drosophila ironensis]